MFGFGKKEQERKEIEDSLLGQAHDGPGGHVGGGSGSELAPGGIVETTGNPAKNALPPSSRGDEDDDFQFNVRQLPQGVIVKRVFPRHAGKLHKPWRVGYQAANGKRLRTEYYGDTLDIAIADLFKNHAFLLEAYNANSANINQ